MTTARCIVWFATLTLTACGEPTTPDRMAAPSFAAGGVGRPSVLVNPNSDDHGTAKTIQEGIDMVAEAGTVMVLPGTYNEALVINKGLTLEGIGGESGPAIVAPPPGVADAIQVTTTDPVVIRSLSVRAGTAQGIHGIGAVDLTVEQATVTAVNPPLGVGVLIRVLNDPNPSGQRARLVVRESFVDGTITDQPAPYPQVFGIQVRGDADALLEGNVIRRAGGACIFVTVRDDLGGVQNVDIVGNDLDECYPLGQIAAIIVGPRGGFVPTPERPLTATGVVNIVGNVIRNSSQTCLTTSAIAYEVYTGRIERNRILNVVQGCAAGTGRNLPSAIWLGRRQHPLFPPVTPTVRFNDIVGNAFAGLRIGANQTVEIDASCNYWGSADGPSGVGPGTGDAVVAEAGGAMPAFDPFATAPIAETVVVACESTPDPVPVKLQASSFANSEWSPPVNLDAINSTFNEQAPSLSPDGLSLYFGSNRPRPGGSTDTDLWVSHRSCTDCPWETPVNLGPVVNSSVGDNGPSLSLDGHLLFFTSARTGVGLNDIYVSHRANPKDDLGWGPPVLLGPGVNTTAFEAGAEYVQSAEDGVANFYFNRGPSQGAQDIYVASITRDGETRGSAVLVFELSDATANDAAASVRTDGREIFFGSNRINGVSGLDIWFSTRRSVHDAWSPPENLAPLNSGANDQQPSLSSDGRTLLFASDRSGSLDIWTSTRTPSGKEIP